MRNQLPIILALSAAACSEPAPRADEPLAPASVPAAAAAHAWRANPASTPVALRGDTLVATTGSHTVVWDETAPELAPPYEVRATLRKRSGRLHEGTGLVFGGTGLEGPESGQVYTYFLTRGDGAYLIKRRQGAETPVVRDWTRHPAVRRDADAAGRPNELSVRVGEAETVFAINGREVARVPSSELALRGRAGVRAAHDVELEVAGFRAARGP
jgi:hypothetical protein